jgi:MFS transporter, BCD family, chlorophyll transporter
MSLPPLGWFSIFRLGLVQTALGSIVVLTTSTLNRVMVVELALPAMIPGALVGLHYALQVMRPRMGYGSDVGGRRTPWIIGGMVMLAAGGIIAAIATAWMGVQPIPAIGLAVIGFLFIGLGVSAAGTSLLVLLAKRVDAAKRPAAATIVWLMMIAGFAITAILAGKNLDPFSPQRLVAVATVVSVLAVLVTVVALAGVEGHGSSPGRQQPAAPAKPSFRAALAQVWAEPEARQFTIFVFVSMLAYSAQDLILEPFAGSVFGMTPGQSTGLGGIQHAGVFAGMVIVAVLGSAVGGRWFGSLKAWTVGGCIASAGALLGLSAAALTGSSWPLQANVFILGVFNGAFAIAAIASMMMLASNGREQREGVRMGLWGAAQAIAFGIGGFAGTLASDVAQYLLGSASTAYAFVFALEAGVFLVSALLASQIGRNRELHLGARASAMAVAGNGVLAEAND